MPFRFDKLTVKAQESVQRAQEIAAQAGNPQVSALHLLAGVLAERDGIVWPVLDKVGVNKGQLNQTVEAELGHQPKVSGGTGPNLGEDCQSVLDAAQ